MGRAVSVRKSRARERKAQVSGLLRLPTFVVPKPARLAVMHRVRAHREQRRARGSDFIVLSRAKSGRTWLRAMLSRLYQRTYGLPESQLLEFDNFHCQNAAVPKILFTHGQYLAKKLHSIAAGSSRPGIVFLVRHPCDVAVSEYFQSTKRASPQKVELHGVETNASMFDFVMSGPMGLPSIIDYLNDWERRLAALQFVHTVRYEAMRERPEEMLSGVASFIEASFSRSQIDEAVQFASFENLKELERQNFFRNSRLTPRDPDDPDSFKVRRGVVGGYRDYFDEEQRSRLDRLVSERLSPSLGYGGAG
jgi:hypothetical protein